MAPSSCRFAVFTLISLLSDNSKGACNLSHVRMGQVLKRHPRNIGRSIDELELAGLHLSGAHRPGVAESLLAERAAYPRELNPASRGLSTPCPTRRQPRGRPKLVVKNPDTAARVILLRNDESKKTTAQPNTGYLYR